VVDVRGPRVEVRVELRAAVHAARQAPKRNPDITPLETSSVGAGEEESVVDEEDLGHRSTIVKDKTTQRSSSKASSRHHEPPPKNKSDRKNRSKNQHLIVKRIPIMSTRNMHIRHVLKNFDWDRGSRLLLKSMTRTNGNLRACMEERLETLTRTAGKQPVITPNHQRTR
jgi:hypothetical protein